MMSTKRFTQRASMKSLPAVPAPPLGQTDLMIMQIALAEVAPEWTADLQGICVHEATLVILPCAGDDAVGPSFLISRETYGFRLDMVHWDMIDEVGVFASLSDVFGALQPRLALSSMAGAPASATLH